MVTTYQEHGVFSTDRQSFRFDEIIGSDNHNVATLRGLVLLVLIYLDQIDLSDTDHLKYRNFKPCTKRTTQKNPWMQT